MRTPDNYVDPPDFDSLFSLNFEGAAKDAVQTLAWLRYLWTGPNPNIAVDHRSIYFHTKHSAQTIYGAIVAEIDRHKVPGVKVGPQILHESGPFSPYRAYLSIRREFDEFLVCAAPVGESYLLSVRKIDYFPHIKWIHYLPFFLVAAAAFTAGLAWAGPLGALLMVALPASFLWSLFRYAAHSTMNWFSKNLPYIPFIGHLYMRWFQPDTFYRQDVHSAFLTVVDSSIHKVIDDLDPNRGLQPKTVPLQGPVRTDLHVAS